MADPFLTLNGQPGEYLSRADTNLLDADTAHLQQSIGQWIASGGAASLVQATDLTPVFGSFHGRCNPSGVVAQASIQDGLPLDTVLMGAGVEHTFAHYLSADRPDLEGRHLVDYFDDIGAVITNLVGDWAPLQLDSFTQLSVTGVSPALTFTARTALQWRVAGGVGDLAASDNLYWDAGIVTEGADATFVPSLRIVSDLDLRVDLSAPFSPPQVDAARMVVTRKFTPAGTEGGFGLFYSEAMGALRFEWQGAAGGILVFNSTDLPPDNTRGVIRFTGSPTTGLFAYTFDGDDIGNGSGITVPLGSGGNDMIIGANANPLGDGPFQGEFFSVELRDGIDGPVVYRMDAADVLAAI